MPAKALEVKARLSNANKGQAVVAIKPRKQAKVRRPEYTRALMVASAIAVLSLLVSHHIYLKSI